MAKHIKPITWEQEEAFQRFVESEARTQAKVNWRRFEDGQFTLELVKADDEPGAGDPTFQQELASVSDALHRGGIPYSQSALALDAIDAHGFPLPEFVVATKTLGPPAITALAGYAAAWARGRSGRKVRLKIGDVEAEGRTVAEIEQLLEKAASFQDRRKSDAK